MRIMWAEGHAHQTVADLGQSDELLVSSRAHVEANRQQFLVSCHN